MAGRTPTKGEKTIQKHKKVPKDQSIAVFHSLYKSTFFFSYPKSNLQPPLFTRTHHLSFSHITFVFIGTEQKLQTISNTAIRFHFYPFLATNSTRFTRSLQSSLTARIHLPSLYYGALQKTSLLLSSIVFFLP